MVKEEKIKRVEELAKLMNDYSCVGLIDAKGMPSDPLQKIRKELRGTALIKFEKKSIIERALDKAGKKELVKLLEEEVTIPALLLTNENAFKIFKIIKKKRSPTFAKPGEKAEREIVVPAGPTDLPPGPIISDLKSVGIKAAIQGQNIVILEDSKLLDEGDEINEKVANVLMKLGIKASSIGLNLVGVLEEGILYTKDILDVDVETYASMIEEASRHALNLAFNATYFTKETMELLLIDAFTKAKNLALNANIYEKDVIQDILAKAHAQALALKNEAKLE